MSGVDDLMTTVLIDDRSGSKDLIKHPPLDSIGVLTRLEGADVCINGQDETGKDILIGLEVKSIADLVSSMANGRLQDTQTPLLVKNHDVSWLICYGGFRPAAETGQLQILKFPVLALLKSTGKWERVGWTFEDYGGHLLQEALNNPKHLHAKVGTGCWLDYSIGKKPLPFGYVAGFVLSFQLTGAMFWPLPDMRSTAWWVGVLARWAGKGKHKSFRKFDQSQSVSLMPGMDDVTKLMAETAIKWPALGYERAVAAANHFECIEDMTTAGVDEWKKVPGIGPVVAKAVRSAITRRRGAE